MNNIQYPLEGSSGWGDVVNSNFHAFEDGIDNLNLNKTEILSTIGNEVMGTTATTLKGAIAEVKGIADSNTTQLNDMTYYSNLLTATLENGVTGYNGSSGIRYLKKGNVVEGFGTISNVADNKTVITTFPLGFRPKMDVYIPCRGKAGGINHFLLKSTGELYLDTVGDSTDFANASAWIPFHVVFINIE